MTVEKEKVIATIRKPICSGCLDFQTEWFEEDGKIFCARCHHKKYSKIRKGDLL